MPVLKMWNGSAWVPVGAPPSSDVIQKAGEIFLWPTTQTHPYAIPCDGTTFSSTTYPQLATALGGTTLPNMQGRFVVGQTSGAGGHPLDVEFDTMGETGGVKSVTLTANQSGLKAHDHPWTFLDGGTDGAFTANDGLQAKRAGTGTQGTWPEGNNAIGQNAAQDASEAHTNLPPYIVMRYMIRTVDGSAISINTAQVEAMQVKAPVRTMSVGNITMANLVTISGVALNAGDRVLVAKQDNAAQNGIYIAGTGAWTRASDADTIEKLLGAYVYVAEGDWATVQIRNKVKRGDTLGSSNQTWVWTLDDGLYGIANGIPRLDANAQVKNENLPPRLQSSSGVAGNTAYNTKTETGWYMMDSTATNAPVAATCYLEVHQYASTYIKQVATHVTNGTRYQRIMSGGVWGSWSTTGLINAASVRRLMASNVVFSNPTSNTVFPAGAEKTALTTTITKRAGSKLLLDVRGTVINTSGVAQPVTLGLRINGVDYAVSTFVIPQATSRQPFSGVVLTPAITAGGSLTIEPWIQSGGIILEFRGPNEDTLSYSVLEVAEDGGASSGFTLPDRLSTNTGAAITDFNSARAAGWYTASATTANAPRTGQWWFVEAVQFPNDNNTLQRATIMNGTEAWQRTYDNGVWSSWTASGGLVGEIPMTTHTTTFTTGWSGTVKYQKFGNVVTVWLQATKTSWATNETITVTPLPVGIRPLSSETPVMQGANSASSSEPRSWWIDTGTGHVRAAGGSTGNIQGSITYQVASAERSTAMASGAETTAIPAAAGAGTVASDTVAYVRGGQVYVNLNMSPTPGLAAGSTLFTLPVGYRPPTTWWELMPIVTAAESTIRLNVLTDGRVQNQVAIPSGVPILRGSLKFPAALSVAGLGTLVDTGWVNAANINWNLPNVPFTWAWAKYRRVGNTVSVRAVATLTGGFSAAATALIDPIPGHPFASDFRPNDDFLSGRVRGIRSGVSWYGGDIAGHTTGGISRFAIFLEGGSGAGWTGTAPATWAAGDRWGIEFEYEAAPL